MAAKNVGVKVARGALYVLLCIVAVIVVIALIIGAYYTAMNTMNVNMLVKDAFGKRAQSVLLPSADGSDREMLEKLFAPQVLTTDIMFASSYYDDYEIINYYEHAAVKFSIVWPWEEETTVTVTERVRDIKGRRIDNDDAEQDESSVFADSERQKPLNWPNGVYEVVLKKNTATDSWKIYDLTLVEPILLEEEEPEPDELGEVGESPSPN